MSMENVRVDVFYSIGEIIIYNNLYYFINMLL